MVTVKPKKKLGQHFLKDEQIAQKIVSDFLACYQSGLIVEIGPGMGVLTKYFFAESDLDFEAQDVDRESVDFLKKQYPDHRDKVKLADFLEFEISKGGGQVNVVGNFPYNISSQIFFKVYESREQVPLIVGMLQKEVAERICARPNSKTYGILSVLLQAFYTTEYLFTVEAHVFDPPPKVRSAVIRLNRLKDQSLDCDARLFKRVVKAGFQQRRKTLRNALKALNLSAKMGSHEILGKRAEQLSVSDFVQLTKLIEEDGRADAI